MSSNIESLLVENCVFLPNESIVKQACISGMDSYYVLCAEAERDYEGFWARYVVSPKATITQDISTLENPAILNQLGPVY